MSSQTYILCPGQGAQSVGMGKDLFASSAAAKSVFEQASEILGFDLGAVCFDGPQPQLDQTNISQPALYACGVSSYRAAVEEGVFEGAAVTAYAGLSLGEYTALHLGGAISFADG